MSFDDRGPLQDFGAEDIRDYTDELEEAGRSGMTVAEVELMRSEQGVMQKARDALERSRDMGTRIDLTDQWNKLKDVDLETIKQDLQRDSLTNSDLWRDKGKVLDKLHTMTGLEGKRFERIVNILFLNMNDYMSAGQRDRNQEGIEQALEGLREESRRKDSGFEARRAVFRPSDADLDKAREAFARKHSAPRGPGGLRLRGGAKGRASRTPTPEPEDDAPDKPVLRTSRRLRNKPRVDMREEGAAGDEFLAKALGFTLPQGRKPDTPFTKFGKYREGREAIDNAFAQKLFSVHVQSHDEVAFYQTAVNMEKAFQSVFSHMVEDKGVNPAEHRQRLLHTVERIIVEARLDTGHHRDKKKGALSWLNQNVIVAAAENATNRVFDKLKTTHGRNMGFESVQFGDDARERFVQKVRSIAKSLESKQSREQTEKLFKDGARAERHYNISESQERGKTWYTQYKARPQLAAVYPLSARRASRSKSRARDKPVEGKKKKRVRPTTPPVAVDPRSPRPPKRFKVPKLSGKQKPSRSRSMSSRGIAPSPSTLAARGISPSPEAKAATEKRRKARRPPPPTRIPKKPTGTAAGPERLTPKQKHKQMKDAEASRIIAAEEAELKQLEEEYKATKEKIYKQNRKIVEERYARWFPPKPDEIGRETTIPERYKKLGMVRAIYNDSITAYELANAGVVGLSVDAASEILTKEQIDTRLRESGLDLGGFRHPEERPERPATNNLHQREIDEFGPARADWATKFLRQHLPLKVNIKGRGGVRQQLRIADIDEFMAIEAENKSKWDAQDKTKGKRLRDDEIKEAKREWIASRIRQEETFARNDRERYRKDRSNPPSEYDIKNARAKELRVRKYRREEEASEARYEAQKEADIQNQLDQVMADMV